MFWEALENGSLVCRVIHSTLSLLTCVFQGNTFPATVFCLFGGFWFTFGATIVPSYNAYGMYSTSGSAADGLNEPQFYATFSFFLVAMAVLCAIFTIASIRTNIVFFLIFILLVPCCKYCLLWARIVLTVMMKTVGCLSASFFAVSHGESANALKLQHIGAGLLLAVSLLGWYIFLALILLSVDFPFILPLGDLSTVVHGRADETRDNKDAV